MPGAKVKPRLTRVSLSDGITAKAPPPSSPSASQATLAAN
jgi:hypothetical protein